MHRILWALSAVFVIAGATGPWMMGYVAEKQFIQSLSHISTDSPYLEVTESKFTRGYQTSRAVVKLRYSLPDSESQPFSLVFQSDIQHSPLTYTNQGVMFLGLYSNDKVTLEGLPDEAQAIYDRYLGDRLFSGNTRVTLGGDYQTSLISQTISAKNKVQNIEFEVGVVKLDLQGDLTGNDLNVLLEMQPSKLISPEMELHLATLTTKSRLARHGDNLYLGDTDLSIPNIKIFNAGMPIDLNDFSITASNKLVKEKLNTRVTYSVATIEAPLPVSSASYSFELNGIALNALELLQNLEVPEADGEDGADAPEEYVEKLLQTLLQPGLQFNQEIKLGAFGGDLLLDLDIEYQGFADAVVFTEITEPLEVINSVQADMLVKATASAVMQSPAAPMVDAFVQQGLISQEGEALSSQVLLENGKLSVNGTDIPLEPIIDKLMDKYVQQQLEELEREEQLEQAEQQSSL